MAYKGATYIRGFTVGLLEHNKPQQIANRVYNWDYGVDK